MRSFQLHIPATMEEAVELLATHGSESRPLGGGTDLVAGVMRDQIIGPGLPYPTHLVDVAGLPELTGIRVEGDGSVVIGAGTKLVELTESAPIAGSWPLVARAAGDVASPEIRAVGTLGGNLHQRPRCWFFRNKDFDCAKKGGDICYAVKGDNRYNAILEGHLCFIVHPSDLATALVALGADARVRSTAGERTIAFDDYFIGPDRDLLRETVLDPGDVLVEVRVPPPGPGTHQAWGKLNEKGKPTWDFAVVSAAVSMTLEDGAWTGGRIVIGGVAPVPYRALALEEALDGRDVRSAVDDAVDEIGRLARPMRDNAYKVDLAKDVVRRVILEALDGPSTPEPGTSRSGR
jgi:xanthine dehydrogenase YagS FAD-binding subunit